MGRAYQRMLLMLNLLVFAGILWAGYWVIQDWRAVERVAPEVSSGFSPSGELDDRRRGKDEAHKDVRRLMQQDIFGTTPVRASSNPIATPEREEVRATDLNLRLHGTVIGRDRPSYAIIGREREKQQELYFEDDYVNDARILRILPDRVIIDRSGERQALLLHPESGSGGKPGVGVEQTGRTGTGRPEKPRSKNQGIP